MTLFHNKYRIESARLKNWDYSNAGAYFITICTKNREHHFGEIIETPPDVDTRCITYLQTLQPTSPSSQTPSSKPPFSFQSRNNIMKLSEIGEIVHQFWEDIPNHFKNVRLGEFVIMPNHLHGILILDKMGTLESSVETLHCNVSTTPEPPAAPPPIKPPINDHDKNQFMSDISPKPGSVSTIIRSFKSACTKEINLNHPGTEFQWQFRFHDHIIRTFEEYQRIEYYILNNVRNWKEDKFY